MSRSKYRNGLDLLSGVEILMKAAATNADELNYRISQLEKINQEHKEISIDLLRQINLLQTNNDNNNHLFEPRYLLDLLNREN